MTRFYITGGWGYGNKGDNAIFEGMRQSFSEKFPHAPLVITSFSQKEMLEQHGLESLPSVHRLLSVRKPLSVFRWLALAVWRLSGRRVLLVPSLRRHLNAMREASVVILGGGGYFNDAWPDMLRSRYVEFELAHAAGTPVMLYGQTIGPFSDATISKSLRSQLSRVAMVAYRDQQSLGVLMACGLNEAARMYTADEANLLIPVPRPVGTQVEGVRIGVMVQKFRPHLSRSGPSAAGRIPTERAYADELVAALLTIADQQQSAQFVFIPSTRWDEPFCASIFNRFAERNSTRAMLLSDPNAKQFIAACQSVNLMVSTNMHPVILAATAGNPSVAISYHYKLDDYMQSIGLAGFVLRIDDFSAESLSARCMSALERLPELRDTVKEHHHKVKAAAQDNMRALQLVLEQEKG